MARLRRIASIVLLSLALGACAAPAPQAAAAQDGTASAGAQARQPVRPPGMSDPLPPQRLPGHAPPELDSSCRTDADCAVKDVGSCCGYQPACVNRDSPTDPAAVRAQCQRQGMASVCGFREVTACSCNAGRCEAAGAGMPVER